MLVGAAGFLAVGDPALHQFGVNPRPAELLAGAVVCAGAALLPDLDHPEATVTRSLGPVTEIPSGFLSSLAGGHRNGTHSFLFAALAGFGSFLLLGNMPHPWGALLIAFFFPALMIRVLTEARGLVCAGLAMIVSTVIVMGHVRPIVLAVSVGLGCLLHMLGDFVTPEGVPPLWPLSRIRWRFPIVARTGDNIEKLIASLCGVWALWAYLTGVAAPVLLHHQVHVAWSKLPLPHITANLGTMVLLAAAGVGMGVLVMQTAQRFRNRGQDAAQSADQTQSAANPTTAAAASATDESEIDDDWVLPAGTPTLADDFIRLPDADAYVEEPQDWPWRYDEGAAEPVSAADLDAWSTVAEPPLTARTPDGAADAPAPVVPLVPQRKPTTDLDAVIRARLEAQPQIHFRPAADEPAA